MFDEDAMEALGLKTGEELADLVKTFLSARLSIYQPVETINDVFLESLFEGFNENFNLESCFPQLPTDKSE